MRERLLLIVGLLSATSVLAEGVGSSGGGKGVLCGTHLRTLDLYEAEETRGRTIDQRFSTVEANIGAFGPELIGYVLDTPMPPHNDEQRKEFAREIKRYIIDKIVDVPEGQSLPLTNDATLPPLKPGCEVVQIAIYNDSPDVIVRDPLLWAMLDVQNQAALILHEAIYKLARDINVKTSDEVREIIGEFMSGRFLEPIFQPVFDTALEKKLMCYAGNSNTAPSEIFEIYAIESSRNGVQGVELHFRILKATLVMNRTIALIENVTLEDLKQNRFDAKQVSAIDEHTGRKWTVKIEGNLPGTSNQLFTFKMFAEGEKEPIESYGGCFPIQQN